MSRTDLTIPELEEMSFGEIKAISLKDKKLLVEKWRSSSDVKPGDVRRAAKILYGLLRPRKTYTDVSQRMLTNKERQKQRREERKEFLAKLGLTPTKREKMSEEEMREKRSERARNRRERKRSLYSELAEKEPDLLKKYGLDPGKYRINIE